LITAKFKTIDRYKQIIYTGGPENNNARLICEAKEGSSSQNWLGVGKAVTENMTPITKYCIPPLATVCVSCSERPIVLY